jgi:hypothetical protein
LEARIFRFNRTQISKVRSPETSFATSVNPITNAGEQWRTVAKADLKETLRNWALADMGGR